MNVPKFIKVEKYIRTNTIEHRENKRLVIVFSTVILLNLLMFLSTVIMDIFELANTTLGRVGIMILSGATSLYFFWLVPLDDRFYDMKSDKIEPIIIERSDVVTKFVSSFDSKEQKMFKCILFTGKSGSGKTTLLKALYPDQIYGDYMGDWVRDIEPSIKIRREVVLDQFECALVENDEIFKLIELCKEHNALLILSFRQEYLAEVIQSIGLSQNEWSCFFFNEYNARCG